ncbi:MAG: sensor histidine kinase [Rhodospirillum sp.]|nr:sensor histidine kinase [Rhodospirillum sp.]MCF8491551.1 sensor histidine kinase [Rhodospirillum sp.]MCF8501940.1 sensor histidine kinase [Rhodospirillum sp.]
MAVAPRSLRGRLLMAGSLWLVTGVTAAYLLLSWAIADTLDRAFQDRLVGLVDSLAAGIDPGPEGQSDPPFTVPRPPTDSRFEQAYSGWYWQVSQGKVQVRSRSLWDEALETHAVPNGRIHVHRTTGPRGHILQVVERDIQPPDIPGLIHVSVAVDRTEVDGDITRLRLLVALCLLALGGGLLAATIAQVTYGLRPLRTLGRTLDRLREEPGARVGENQPDEIAPLARALNGVLDHDAALIDRARTHVGNLAHGLKTPLAVLNAAAGEGEAVPAVTVRAETAIMARLVDRHLARARAAAGSADSLGTRVSVRETAERLKRTFSALHHRPVDFTLDIGQSARFPGDADDLMEILGNLMDNGGKWAESLVLVTALQTDGGLFLTVEDDGPGLPEGEADAALARGARLDDAKPGHGLGLDIVSDLVDLRGGTMTLDRSPLGGLRVTLHFP